MKQVATARECAAAVLEGVPHLMRVLRAQVRSQSNPDLSMPQFRTLAFLGRNAGAMLVDVATFLALTPPAASKLVDGLFNAGLVSRDAVSDDRRRVALNLTPAGRQKYAAAVRTAENYLAERIEQLDGRTRAEILRSVAALQTIFEAPSEVRRPIVPRRVEKV